ncbi:MAG: serine/threonine protein kinase [Deltaproteobacteria bacterium]|nr:MAG: serine/threonine protein kinase [Deltaproteobacteria bacterium]
MFEPRLFGKYILVDKIAIGGMAEIFKAKTFGVEGFEKTVVIKQVLTQFSRDEEFITMLIDEGKIAGQLSHSNIAQVHALDREIDNYYIAMEFIDGKDLRTIIKMGQKMGEPLSREFAIFIGMEIAQALDYAHRKRDARGTELNIIHRDISPQNILISYEGEVKLTDFGIAKAAIQARMSQSGVLKGKYAYMSPEQARGETIDRRSDIFSLGIVIYEMLTGKRLFLGDSDIGTLEKVKEAQVEPPSKINENIPKELEASVLKALAKEPSDRYQDASSFHKDLARSLHPSWVSSADLSRYLTAVFQETIRKEKQRMEEIDNSPLMQRCRETLMAQKDEPALDIDYTRTTTQGIHPDRTGKLSPQPPRSKKRTKFPRWAAAAGVILILIILGFGIFWLKFLPTSKPLTPSTTPVVKPIAEKKPSATIPEPSPPQPTKAETNLPPRPPPAPQPKPVVKKEYGFLDINALPWAYVYIDGVKYEKPTPILGLKLTVGEHHLRLLNPYKNLEKELTVEIKKDQTIKKIIDLKQ